MTDNTSGGNTSAGNTSAGNTAAVRTFPIDDRINLHVRTGHGSVSVETADGLTEATVRLDGPQHLIDQFAVEFRAPNLAVVGPRQGGLFDLGMLGGRFGGPSGTSGVDISVTIPTGTAIKIATASAPIRVTGTVSGADIAFGRADAELDHVSGDVRFRFGAGTARATRVDGSVEMRSGAGTGEFDEVGGDLRVGCGTGDVRAQIVRGSSRVRTGSGDTRLEEVHGDVNVASGAGSLQIGLPSGVTAQLDVHSASGSARSELPVEQTPHSKDGAITVRARTGHGDIRVFRSAAAPISA